MSPVSAIRGDRGRPWSYWRQQQLQSLRVCPVCADDIAGEYDATRWVNTMLVAIQKDPTIDAIFSIGSCCGPAMVTVREQLRDRANGMQSFASPRARRPGESSSGHGERSRRRPGL